MYAHLCFSFNDLEIVYDPRKSHTATHFNDTPELKSSAIEVISSLTLTDETVFIEKDLGRIIGTTDFVETTDKDKIIYAKRANRDNYTRFTSSQTPQECSSLVVYLKRLNAETYELSSAWIGHSGPSFPGDENETPESKPYWNSHALR